MISRLAFGEWPELLTSGKVEPYQASLLPPVTWLALPEIKNLRSKFSRHECSIQAKNKLKLTGFLVCVVYATVCMLL